MMDTKRLTVKYVVIGLEVSVSYWQEETLWVGQIDLPGTVAKRTKEGNIAWDPARTTILRAYIHGRIWAGAGSKGTIRFNGAATQFCDATFWDAVVETDFDVPLKNGLNNCSIELVKVLGLDKAGIFTADLTIEYTGDPPTTGPVEDVTPELPDYTWLIYAGIGIAALFGIGYVLSGLRPPMIIQV